MTRTLLFVAAILVAACTQSIDSDSPVKKTLTARRVRLDVEQRGENLVIKGDMLRLNLETLDMNLVGNASVTVDEPMSFRADAAEITFRDSLEIVELSGGVHTCMGAGIKDTIDGEPSNL